MKLRLSLLLNLLLLFALIWLNWPIFGKKYKQDGVWQLAEPAALGPDGAKAVLRIEDGLVVFMHDGCRNAGTDGQIRSPFWNSDAIECPEKPVTSFMQNIRPFSGVEYDADHDIVFAPDHMSGRKFVRKNESRELFNK
jgi:hypothetical protein